MDIFADLVAEQDRLEGILDSLDDETWNAPSGALGWTVADVVLHLAQTEEAVVNSVAGRVGISNWRAQAENLDDAIDQMVSAERTTPQATFERWRVARREAVAAMMGADPEQRFQWAAWPLKPKTLATTRLAEHWAHALDITRPLGLPFPDTDRLRHIAWLGHGTLPYAFNFVGQEPHPVFCELTAPDGSLWRYGPADADSTITGAAGAFCRVGAHRLAPDESGLVARGPHGMAALRVLRNYAG